MTRNQTPTWRLETQRLGIVASVLALGAVLLRYVTLENEYLIALATLAPWLLVATLLFTAIAYGLKAFVGCGAIVGLAVALALPGAGIPRTGCSVVGGAGDGTDSDVVVFSQNTLFGSPDPADVATQALEVGADVVVLQESQPAFSAAVMVELGPDFAHSTTSSFRAIISRFPIESVEASDGDGDSDLENNVVHGLVAATLETSVGPLLVTNVHAPPPHIEGGRQRQLREFDTLVELSASTNIVAVGDYNAPPADKAYRDLLEAGGFVDAHSSVGCGFGVTWSPLPGFGPAWLSLDHALVSGDLEIVAFELLDYDGSDHKAIAVRLGT